jgi:Predicted glycosyltransferases
MGKYCAEHSYACVVLNYNNFKECLEYVTEISNMDVYDLIVVVDNNSPDNSYDKLKHLNSDSIVVVKERKNRGYGAGNNAGIKIAYEHGCDIAFISNSDVSYDLTCFSAICECFDIYKNAVVCSAIQRNGFTGNILKDSTWDLPTYSYYIKSSFLYINRFFNKSIEYSDAPYMPVDCVAGAFLAVKIKPFLEVGGYDERVFLYCEESILGHRLKEHGFITYISCQTGYMHYESSTISKNVPNSINRFRMVLDNRLFYMKNYLHVSKPKYIFAKICFWLAVRERYLQLYVKRIKGFIR